MLHHHRIALHKIPELGFQEFKTKRYILEHVRKFDCSMHHIGKTGLLLYFDAQASHTIAFRADMDALPIEEQTGLPFSSSHPGHMHACGHDGHMAILLELTEYIHKNRKNLDTNIVLIFQPSEESEGGARSIMESGTLQHYNVEAVFGLHLWPGLPKGTVYSRANELMAMSSETTITIKGRNAHVADSEKGIDSLRIASHYLTAVYQMEEAIDSSICRLLKFGKIQSGTLRNIISDYTHIEGTLRSYDPSIHQLLKKQLRIIADRYETQTGCTIIIDYNDGYPAVLNNPELYSRIQSILPELNELTRPVLQAEDFSVYTQSIPSVFFLLGVGDTPSLHQADFDFDMTVLDEGVKLFKTILNGYSSDF